MEEESVDILHRLMKATGPSGFEEETVLVWLEEAVGVTGRTWVDTHGNGFAVVNEGGSPRVMLAGHADTIGFIITYIHEDGYLSFATIGMWDLQILPGQRIRIKGKGGMIKGVIGRKPVHALSKEERERVVKVDDLWIDIGASDKKQASALVEVGDPAVLDYEDFVELNNHRITGYGMDNRVGAFVVLEALRLVSKMGTSAAVFSVATVQEEIGLRGAQTASFGIDPQAAIAVDLTHATDIPGVDREKKALGEVSIGNGPVITRGPNINPTLYKLLVGTADERGIPYQTKGAPSVTLTDANVIQVTRSGVPTALVSVPSRYMHSPCELVCLEDCTNAFKLIAYTVTRIHEIIDSIP